MFKFVKHLFVLCGLALGTPALAFDMGPLNTVLELGVDGVWETRDDGASYVFENDQDPDAIKYYYLHPRAGEEGRRTVSVSINFRDVAPSTRAGFVFGFDENTGGYFIFTLSPSGEILLFERTANGGEVKFRGTTSNLQQGLNHLTLEENGASVSLIVNGGASLVTDNPAMARGGVGILAWGVGETGFRDFTYRVPEK